MSLSAILLFSMTLFTIGVVGLLVNRQSLIALLMSLELILLAVNTNFIAFSQSMHSLSGQIFVFFILTVAAAEAAIGLAIIVILFRSKKNIAVEQLNELKG